MKSTTFERIEEELKHLQVRLENKVSNKERHEHWYDRPAEHLPSIARGEARLRARHAEDSSERIQ